MSPSRLENARRNRSVLALGLRLRTRRLCGCGRPPPRRSLSPPYRPGAPPRAPRPRDRERSRRDSLRSRLRLRLFCLRRPLLLPPSRSHERDRERERRFLDTDRERDRSRRLLLRLRLALRRRGEAERRPIVLFVWRRKWSLGLGVHLVFTDKTQEKKTRREGMTSAQAVANAEMAAFLFFTSARLLRVPYKLQNKAQRQTASLSKRMLQ